MRPSGRAFGRAGTVVAMSEPKPSNTARRWAIAGLILACIWLVLALLPILGTTLLGLPFLAIALTASAVALYLRWERKTSGVLRWTGSALILSGFGCLWQVVMAVVWGGVIVGGGLSLWQSLQQWLQATPVP